MTCIKIEVCEISYCSFTSVSFAVRLQADTQHSLHPAQLLKARLHEYG